MKRTIFLVAGLCFSPALWAVTTYTYFGLPFETIHIFNFTPPCATGPCANYTASNALTGSFSTATPLTANLTLANVFPSVTAYSFTDGINAYSKSDPNSRVIWFLVSTDAIGNITSVQITFQLWKTGTSPHIAGDRTSVLDFFPNFSQAVNNTDCDPGGVGVSPAGMADTCLSQTIETNATSLGETAAGTWSVTTAVIPTLSNWALAALAILTAGAALCPLRRRTSP